MAQDNLRRYMWLVNTIYRAGRITFTEINRRWVECPLSGGNPLPLRTFHNYRAAIAANFDINICCYKPRNEYYIENSDDLASNDVASWLLNSFAVSNIAFENREIRDRIILEHIPSAQRHLDPILQALREERIIRITYNAFDHDEAHTVEVKPYFVKCYERRWYLFAPSVDDGVVKSYGLDRILELELTDRRFVYPKDFSPTDHLIGAIGISNYPDTPPRHIVIRCTELQRRYLEALPLHPSQRVEEQGEEYSLISFWLAPTNEFYRRILSHREHMEIVSPPEVRSEFAAILDRMFQPYYEEWD